MPWAALVITGPRGIMGLVVRLVELGGGEWPESVPHFPPDPLRQWGVRPGLWFDFSSLGSSFHPFSVLHLLSP